MILRVLSVDRDLGRVTFFELEKATHVGFLLFLDKKVKRLEIS